MKAAIESAAVNEARKQAKAISPTWDDYVRRLDVLLQRERIWEKARLQDQLIEAEKR